VGIAETVSKVKVKATVGNHFGLTL